MLLYTRLTRTDTEFTRDDDIIAADTTDGDVAIAIPHFVNPGAFKPIQCIIKNLRGNNNVIVSSGDENVLIEGQRSVTVGPGFAIWLAPINEGDDHLYYEMRWQSPPP